MLDTTENFVNKKSELTLHKQKIRDSRPQTFTLGKQKPEIRVFDLKSFKRNFEAAYYNLKFFRKSTPCPTEND